MFIRLSDAGMMQTWQMYCLQKRKSEKVKVSNDAK